MFKEFSYLIEKLSLLLILDTTEFLKPSSKQCLSSLQCFVFWPVRQPEMSSQLPGESNKSEAPRDPLDLTGGTWRNDISDKLFQRFTDQF